MTEYVYVTKYALIGSFGIERYAVAKRTPKTVVVSSDILGTTTFHRDDCLASLDEAKQVACAKRDAAVASHECKAAHHESEIARLKAMTFDTVREG